MMLLEIVKSSKMGITIDALIIEEKCTFIISFFEGVTEKRITFSFQGDET